MYLQGMKLNLETDHGRKGGQKVIDKLGCINSSKYLLCLTRNKIQGIGKICLKQMKEQTTGIKDAIFVT